MGRSLSQKIVYGYSIGGREDGWQFEEYDENKYTMQWPAWVELDNGDVGESAEPDDFISQAQDRLLNVIGGFEDSDDWMTEGEVRDAYYDRKQAAEKKLGGVEFCLYGYSDYTEWVIGFELADGYDGISEIDKTFLANLLNPVNVADMDYKLDAAIRALELHPKGQSAGPRLLLLSSYF